MEILQDGAQNDYLTGTAESDTAVIVERALKLSAAKVMRRMKGSPLGLLDKKPQTCFFVLSSFLDADPMQNQVRLASFLLFINAQFVHTQIFPSGSRALSGFQAGQETAHRFGAAEAYSLPIADWPAGGVVTPTAPVGFA